MSTAVLAVILSTCVPVIMISAWLTYARAAQVRPVPHVLTVVMFRHRAHRGRPSPWRRMPADWQIYNTVQRYSGEFGPRAVDLTARHWEISPAQVRAAYGRIRTELGGC